MIDECPSTTVTRCRHNAPDASTVYGIGRSAGLVHLPDACGPGRAVTDANAHGSRIQLSRQPAHGKEWIRSRDATAEEAGPRRSRGEKQRSTHLHRQWRQRVEGAFQGRPDLPARDPGTTEPFHIGCGGGVDGRFDETEVLGDGEPATQRGIGRITGLALGARSCSRVARPRCLPRARHGTHRTAAPACREQTSVTCRSARTVHPPPRRCD